MAHLYNEETISQAIDTKWAGKTVHFAKETDSTNSWIKRLAKDGAEHGTLAVAEFQSAGRGRFDRRWEAPEGSSIMMTLLLRPEFSPQYASMLTLVMGMAVAQAAEELGFNVSIKWPNDIVISKKKICGILTEMGTNGVKINYVLIGVGINVNLKEFAEAVNYLMENKLLTLEALESRLSAVSTEFDTLSDTMKAKSARMKELQELIRQAENYKRLKPVYDELNGIKWKKQREKFETAHDADLRLFYTARRILKEKLDRKPITLAAWKQEYDRLQAEYAKLSPQYKPLREDLMKMRRVQYCVDRVLQRRQPEQEAPKKKQDIEL